MNWNRLRITASAAVLSAAATAPVHADDTDLFYGAPEDIQAPNVLFVIDTSGSMGAQVHNLPALPYDHAETYEDAWENGVDDDAHLVFYTSMPPGDPDDIDPDSAAALRIPDSGSSPADGPPFDYDHPGDLNLASMFRNCDARDLQTFLETGSVTLSVAQLGLGAPWDNGWKTGIQSFNYNTPVDCAAPAPNRRTYTFYMGNYINYEANVEESRTASRLEVVKEIVNWVVQTTPGVRTGLMRFDYDADAETGSDSEGGWVDLPVDIGAAHRERVADVLDDYTAGSSTPLAETLYEAGRYWRGEPEHFGDDTRPRTTHPDALDGGRYRSPIDHECRNNYVVVLTDGTPQADDSADGAIASLTGGACTGNCFDELAEFLADSDQSSAIDGHNGVVTHTVGFRIDDEILRSAARRSGGQYHTVDTYEALREAIKTLLVRALTGSSLFSAPAVSVNAFNRLSHADAVYFAMFEPGARDAWAGNVKRFRYDPAGGALVDVHGDPAVNDATGQFHEGATSFWTAAAESPDGNEVRLGGAGGRLTASRNVRTNPVDDADIGLTSAGTELHEDNPAITAAMLGVTGNDERERLLRWARGEDVDDLDADGDDTDRRYSMGDPLHSRPVLVTYGEDEDSSRGVLFVATNDGYLQAIDAQTGDEIFSFIPRDLLGNLHARYMNPETTERTYGLDGPISVLRDDGRVHLFVGMRRGGRNYYALDVTMPDAPELMWTLRGGSGEFSELGQTWSRATPTRVRIGNTEHDVLVFAGGYDPDQDEAPARAADDQGRAIYIVDAATGERLWSGGPNPAAHEAEFEDMKYSIPSEIRLLDMDHDGLADQMYVGDMGGQVWRFDIHNGEDRADLVTGGVIAELAEDESEAARRFYYPPDLALMNGMESQWLALSIGSGWRANPLDTEVEDRFHMLRVEPVLGPPRDDNGFIEYESIDADDLYDATANVLGSDDADDRSEARDDLEAAAGWYIDLERPGEKVLARSLALAGTVIFTTYVPGTETNAGGCTSGAGTGRAYAVGLEDATPYLDAPDGGGAPRSVVLRRAGIPPAPTVLFTGGGADILVGTEQPLPAPTDARKRLIYWRE